jgi:hypothetical protein
VTRVWRAAAVLGIVYVAVGAWALAASLGDSLTKSNGALLGSTDLELRLMAFNPLGASVIVAIGLVGLLGGWWRRRLLVVLAAVGAATTVVQVLVQWGQGSSNVFGAVGANLSFGLFGLAGFGTLVWVLGFDGTTEPATARAPERTT